MEKKKQKFKLINPFSPCSTITSQPRLRLIPSRHMFTESRARALMRRAEIHFNSQRQNTQTLMLLLLKALEFLSRIFPGQHPHKSLDSTISISFFLAQNVVLITRKLETINVSRENRSCCSGVFV